MNEAVGQLQFVSGFIVRAQIDGPLTVSERVLVGPEKLSAEVISIESNKATIQIYEDTTGIRMGDPVFPTGEPFSAILGPGILGSVTDGLQRPLTVLKERSGIYIQKGQKVPVLNLEKQWDFQPRAEKDKDMYPGDLLGVVQETPLIEHRILVPANLEGKLVKLAQEGSYRIEDTIAEIEGQNGRKHSVNMIQKWPIRRARPIRHRIAPNLPLMTGQRVIDTFFPVAKGGTAAIPGGFGTGKTVLQHSLAQWSDADIIIYIGCGERGNEMTEVLEDFPELKDPWSGHPLMERTMLIANTSDMPVSARESSIYTGLTIAEYYRDQGYDVALMADSTSRWAQSLREISGRLGEMPVEEGYPAYLATRLAAFYERAGRVETLGDQEGSITVVGAVSPPGGDFSEPVTRHTQRFTECWWALSSDLAHKRHYPAIDWQSSYSLELANVTDWWQEKTEADWSDLRSQAMQILHEESGLQQLVQLVGPDALSDSQQLLLTAAKLLREGFLQQNALHPKDAYSKPDKQTLLLESFVRIYNQSKELLDSGMELSEIQEAMDTAGLIRMKEKFSNEELDQMKSRRDEMLENLKQLKKQK